MKRLTGWGISRILLISGLLISFNYLGAQEQTKDELARQAVNLFDAAKYKKAATAFEKLLQVYPNELSYNYYLGVSYLLTNENPDTCILLLKQAASKNFRPEVHFYLAEAYYYNYQFDEAEISLLNFRNLASRKCQNELNANALQLAIHLARDEVYMVNNVHMLSKDKLKTYQIEGVYAKHVPGKFALMPDAFMATADHEHGYQGMMYHPRDPKNGYFYFITSYGKNGKKGKDIYRIRQITALNYTLPEYMYDINTSANEEYPYFDTRTQTLYFSSDRDGGLGGYDIYKARYDKITNTFSEPKRLEFPINTAYDDFLYVPDTSNHTSLFLSDRHQSGRNLMVYKIEQTETPDFVFPKSTEEIKSIARFDVMEEQENIKAPELPPLKQDLLASEYDEVLREALTRQLICDSLRTELLVQKNKLRKTEDQNERRVLMTSVVVLEKQIKAEQEGVDQLFTEAQGLEEDENVFIEEQVEEKLLVEDPVKLQKNVNGIKLYSYLPSEQYAELSRVDPVTVSESKRHVSPTANLLDFEILNNSPYSDTKPIPTNDKLPDGLIYRIQLGAFGKKLPMNAFGGLSPVSAEIIEERNLTKYYVGYFSSSKQANLALEEVKRYGFGDAFIVPFFQQKKISINDARELEFGEKLGAK
jgi:hypothetical protein